VVKYPGLFHLMASCNFLRICQYVSLLTVVFVERNWHSRRPSHSQKTDVTAFFFFCRWLNSKCLYFVVGKCLLDSGVNL
jgi:hypothetical protein